jgi:hypothetical protein
MPPRIDRLLDDPELEPLDLREVDEDQAKAQLAFAKAVAVLAARCGIAGLVFFIMNRDGSLDTGAMGDGEAMADHAVDLLHTLMAGLARLDDEDDMPDPVGHA